MKQHSVGIEKHEMYKFNNNLKSQEPIIICGEACWNSPSISLIHKHTQCGNERKKDELGFLN